MGTHSLRVRRHTEQGRRSRAPGEIDLCPATLDAGYVGKVTETTPATATEPIRVFLLDDHEIVRRGLKELLEASGELEIVGEAGTAEEGLSRLSLIHI